MEPKQKVQKVAGALADPLRIMVLEHLMAGPATVSEIIECTGESQSKVSNHLALLRERELVRASRRGRMKVYELYDGSIARLVEALLGVAGASPGQLEWKSPSIMAARTCYDHLAGQFGVALFDAFVNLHAIKEPKEPHDPVELGPAAEAVFENQLAIDIEQVKRERRRFAYACLDWTERKFHLGGALGAAVWATFVEHGWVVKKPGTREVIVTKNGKTNLKSELQIDLKDIDMISS